MYEYIQMCIYIYTCSNMYHNTYTKNDVQTCVSMYTHSWIFLYIPSTCNPPNLGKTRVKILHQHQFNLEKQQKHEDPKTSNLATTWAPQSGPPKVLVARRSWPFRLLNCMLFFFPKGSGLHPIIVGFLRGGCSRGGG